MIRWALLPGRKPAGFLAKVAELRAAAEHASPGGARNTLADPDWDEFERQFPDSPEEDHAEQIKTLERRLAFFDFKLQKAIRIHAQDDIKFYSEQVIKFSNAVRQQKLMADKLGLEKGDLLARSQAELYFRAWAFWAMRAVDASLNDLSPRLVSLTFPEEVRAVLEPSLLNNRFLIPFVLATKVESGVSLPEWALDCVRDAVDDYIEHGAASFEKLFNATADGSTTASAHADATAPAAPPAGAS